MQLFIFLFRFREFFVLYKSSSSDEVLSVIYVFTHLHVRGKFKAGGETL